MSTSKQSGKHHKHSTRPPLTPASSPPVAATSEPRKLRTAEEIEQLTNLKRHALYRLSRANRVPFYRVGRRSGLRFIVEEVLNAIRQAPKPESGSGEANG